MNIETERLILRELIWKDVPDIHQMNSLEAVAKYNTIGIPKIEMQTASMFKPVIEDVSKNPRKIYGWTIRQQNSNEFMGEIGMNIGPKRFKIAEIHYSLLPIFWGNGYATEAVRAILDFGFNTLKLHRIEAGVATENEKSLQLLERVGMTQEGRRRKILPINKEWKDNYHYAILEEDYFSNSPYKQ